MASKSLVLLPMRALPISTFLLPGASLALLAGSLASGNPVFSAAAVALGLGKLAVVAVRSVREGSWSLDYIAFLAMGLSALLGEWTAGAVIALMYTGGEALEEYASRRAETSLADLLSRIPKEALVEDERGVHPVPLREVPEGATIVVRTGELVPLDGVLVSKLALLNLANLTGEPLPERVTEGAFIKSGSVNAGEAIALTVSGTLATSTYAKIVDLVRAGAEDQAPFVRLADRANLPFTILTFLIAGGAYLLTGDLVRVLAVLVIATPCPLIIAAPVAFVGGLSRAAGSNIIVKRPLALEIAARVSTVFFDKTGTLTLGEPALSAIELLDGRYSETKALSVAASLDYHSIHPTARALVLEAQHRGLTPYPALKVTETIGTGIAGLVGNRYASLEQAPSRYRREGAMSLLLSEDGEPVALFHLADLPKPYAKQVLGQFAQEKKVAILTGDRKERAEAAFDGNGVEIHAELDPEHKFAIIDEAKKRGETVAMVGDGLNDAPALAKADVGIVFSGTENSAAIEAADVAILGHDPRLVREFFSLSARVVRIAEQSVWAGIGLSVIGQVAAAGGFIPPVAGAILQEGIDVAVILNALRAAFPPRG